MSDGCQPAPALIGWGPVFIWYLHTDPASSIVTEVHAEHYEGILDMHAGHGTMKLIADHAGADDWAHDPWGTANMLAFDICAVLDAADVDGDLTPVPFARWQYRRGAHTVPSLESLAQSGDSYGEESLAQALLDGTITTTDLVYAGNVMDRYIDLLRTAGRDY